MSDTTPRDKLVWHALNVLCNVTSFPRAAQPALLGQNMRPLAEALADELIERGWRPPARVRHLGQRVTDPDVEATYVTLTMVSRVGNTVEFEGQTILDLDPDGHLIGVELIGPVEPKED